MKKLFMLSTLGLLMMISACNIINPSEDIPATLIINEVSFSTNSSEGSASHKITDVWVYVQSELIGVFPLPAEIPVLEEGDTEVLILAGIKVNGIAASPDFHRFYTGDERTINFQPGESVTIVPAFKYIDGINFKVLEDFEGINHTLSDDKDGDDNTRFNISGDGAFEGTSGVAKVTSSHPILLTGSDLIAPLPSQSIGYTSYVELNYKTELPVAMGLSGFNASGDLIYTDFKVNEVPTTWGVQKSENWNKIYFDISANMQAMAANNDVVEYQLVISSYLDQFAQDTMPEAKIYIDNVKLIHF